MTETGAGSLVIGSRVYPLVAIHLAARHIILTAHTAGPVTAHTADSYRIHAGDGSHVATVTARVAIPDISADGSVTITAPLKLLDALVDLNRAPHLGVITVDPNPPPSEAP